MLTNISICVYTVCNMYYHKYLYMAVCLYKEKFCFSGRENSLINQGNLSNVNNIYTHTICTIILKIDESLSWSMVQYSRGKKTLLKFS